MTYFRDPPFTIGGLTETKYRGVWLGETPNAIPPGWLEAGNTRKDYGGGLVIDRFADVDDDLHDPPVPPLPLTHLMQVGVKGGNIYEQGDRFYANRRARASDRSWDVVNSNAVAADGFADGVFPAWRLIKDGYLDRACNWINWPPPAGTTLLRGGLMMRLYRDGAILDEDAVFQYFQGRIFEWSYTGGAGDDLTIGFYNPSNFIINDARRKVFPIVAEDWFYFYMLPADFGSKNLTTFRNETLREVQLVSGSYVPVDSGVATNEFKAATANCSIVRHMDTQEAIVMPALSMAAIAPAGAPYNYRNAQGFSYVGVPIEELLQAAEEADQIAHIHVPLHLCSPVRPGFLLNYTVGGVRKLAGSFDDPNRQPGSFSKIGGSEVGDATQGAGTFTCDANGYWTWIAPSASIPNNTFFGFSFQYTDIEGNVIGPCRLRFPIGGNEVSSTDWTLNGDNGGAELNASIIMNSPEWNRSANNFLDRLVASGYSPSRMLIVEQDVEAWNFAYPWGQSAHYCWSIAKGIYGSPQNWMKGYGQISARWQRAVRERMAARGLNYNILFALAIQTVNTDTALYALQGAHDYFTNAGLTPNNYLAPGKCEIFGTTYLNAVFWPDGNGASGQTTEAANLNWWLARIADGTAGDLAYAWLTSATPRNENVQLVVTKWAELMTIAKAKNTVLAGAYEGGSHHRLDGFCLNLWNNTTFRTWFLAWHWGAQHASVFDLLHQRLKDEVFDGETMAHPPIFSNFTLGLARDALQPWNDGVLEAVTPMRTMFNNWGREAP